MTKVTSREELKDLTPDRLIIIDSIEFIMESRPDYNTEDILKLLTRKIRQYKSRPMLSKKRAELRAILERSSKMKPMDRVLLNSINQLVRSGFSKAEIEGYLLQGFEDRSQKNNKSRMKGLVNEILLKIDKPEVLEVNNEANKELVERLQVVGII